MLGASPATDWFSTDCPNATRRARLLDDGHVEIDGLGIVASKMPDAVKQWVTIVLKYAKQYGVPPQFVAGVICAESGGAQKACNPEGGQRKTCDDAPDFLTNPQTGQLVISSKTGQPIPVNKGVGLMQITDPGLKAGHSNSELLNDPDLNVRIGTEYLGKSWKRYGGNFVKALASYNAGSARCWTADTKSSLKQNPWGAVMTGDYVSTVIRFTNGCVDSGLFTSSAQPEPPPPPPPVPTTCPDGYEKDASGNCIPIAIAQNCPEGFERDPSGNCVSTGTLAQGCPEGFELDLFGNCVITAKPPVPTKPPVSAASSSGDGTPLLLVAGAAALAYYVFFNKKKFT